MNTPAHLVLNLALLGRVAPVSVAPWIAVGALLPDLPMFTFYAWQRWVRAAPEPEVWGVAYFDPAWQQLFDAFNSAPIFVALGLIALGLRRAGPAWLCASVLLHGLADAFLHREDGHRHLWPLADWRFQSPVSYWDPAYYGVVGAGIETLAIFASTWLLWSAAGRVTRALLAALCALAAAAWIAFYALGWFPG